MFTTYTHLEYLKSCLDSFEYLMQHKCYINICFTQLFNDDKNVNVHQMRAFFDQ